MTVPPPGQKHLQNGRLQRFGVVGPAVADRAELFDRDDVAGVEFLTLVEFPFDLASESLGFSFQM